MFPFKCRKAKVIPWDRIEKKAVSTFITGILLEQSFLAMQSFLRGSFDGIPVAHIYQTGAVGSLHVNYKPKAEPTQTQQTASVRLRREW